MKQILSTLLIIILFLVPSISLAKTKNSRHTNVRHGKEKPAQVTYVSEQDQQHDGKQLENRIAKIQKAIQELAQSYKDRTIWENPSKPPPNEGDGHKIARYVMLVPTYAARFATWPFAVVGSELIKHGAITKIIDFFSTDDRRIWFYPKLELGFGSGFGGGLGFTNFDFLHDDYQLSAYYQIHINLNQESEISIKKDNAFQLWNKPVWFKANVQFVRHPQQDYFGIGPSSSQSNRAKYGHNEIQTGGWIGYEILDNFFITPHAYFIWNRSQHGKDGTSVEDRFAPSEIQSFDDSVYYIDFGFSLIHDTRDSEAAPERGGTRRLTFKRFQSLGLTNYDYNEYQLDIAQYIPSFYDNHVLVLRNVWNFQQSTGGEIPFYRLVKIDINSPVRGFSYGRYTDTADVVFNVEYRFPVWRFMDGVFFFDSGRVFKNPSDFSFKHFKYAGGGGIRIHTKEFFLMRLELGYGGEGVKVLMKTSQAF